jgi:glucuronate isomerase
MLFENLLEHGYQDRYVSNINDTPIPDIHCHTGITDDRKLKSKIMWLLMA